MQGHGAHTVRAIHEAALVDKGCAHGGTHTSSLCPEEERLLPERRSCCDQRECPLSKHTVTWDFQGVEVDRHTGASLTTSECSIWIRIYMVQDVFWSANEAGLMDR